MRGMRRERAGVRRRRPASGGASLAREAARAWSRAGVAASGQGRRNPRQGSVDFLVGLGRIHRSDTYQVRYSIFRKLNKKSDTRMIRYQQRIRITAPS
jgi:hypothetical protein